MQSEKFALRHIGPKEEEISKMLTRSLAHDFGQALESSRHGLGILYDHERHLV